MYSDAQAVSSTARPKTDVDDQKLLSQQAHLRLLDV